MARDRQVRRLWRLLAEGKPLSRAARQCDMDEKTARKYRQARRLSSELAAPRTHRTRMDPFAEVWDEVHEQLSLNPGLQAKTLFEHLQRKYPGRFQEGQLRTFQRGVKRWRATSGPAQEVYFDQVHHPGDLCSSPWGRRVFWCVRLTAAHPSRPSCRRGRLTSLARETARWRA